MNTVNLSNSLGINNASIGLSSSSALGSNDQAASNSLSTAANVSTFNRLMQKSSSSNSANNAGNNSTNADDEVSSDDNSGSQILTEEQLNVMLNDHVLDFALNEVLRMGYKAISDTYAHADKISELLNEVD